MRLREKTGWDTVVLDEHYQGGAPLLQPGSDSVAQVILRSIPEPDDSTPWEKILDYRSDPDARGRFLRLKSWVNGLVNNKKSPSELEDELSELVYEYEQYMKLHKMKVGMSAVETFVTVSAEIVEGLVKLKWSDAAKALFSIKHKKVALLEAERAAPGRQVAYIVDVKEKFR